MIGALMGAGIGLQIAGNAGQAYGNRISMQHMQEAWRNEGRRQEGYSREGQKAADVSLTGLERMPATAIRHQREEVAPLNDDAAATSKALGGKVSARGRRMAQLLARRRADALTATDLSTDQQRLMAKKQKLSTFARLSQDAFRSELEAAKTEGAPWQAMGQTSSGIGSMLTGAGGSLGGGGK